MALESDTANRNTAAEHVIDFVVDGRGLGIYQLRENIHVNELPRSKLRGMRPIAIKYI
jgi:hypothetical protein